VAVTDAPPDRIVWLPGGNGFTYANQPSSAPVVGPADDPGPHIHCQS